MEVTHFRFARNGTMDRAPGLHSRATPLGPRRPGPARGMTSFRRRIAEMSDGRAEYRRVNRERRRVNTRRWETENPERHRASTAAAYQRRKVSDPTQRERNTAHRRLRKYGVTPEQYDHMVTQQGGVCACCGEPPKARSLHVDHDHKTGKVRQLLCLKCNTAIGFLEHQLRPVWDEYLSKHAG